MRVLFFGVLAITACHGDAGGIATDGATDGGACEEGTTRGCGTDVGLCEFGSQTCAGGVWGECEGGVVPVDETCGNRTDEDCDGLVDELCGWVVRAGGSDDDFCRALTLVSDGVVATGYFRGSATFGQGEPNETTLAGDGMFLARYGLDGSLTWAKQATSAAAQAVAALPDGGVLVAGSLTGQVGPSTATFGPGEPNETVLVDSTGSPEIFVARYASDGTLVWAKQAGGDGTEWASDIAARDDGGALVTGGFGYDWYWSESATFGPGETNETTLTSGGMSDIFVARYDPEGSLVWAKRAGGAESDSASGIAALEDGTALVTGDYGSGGPNPTSATFGLGEANETVLVDSTGRGNIFAARYQPSGDLDWAVWAGGSEEDYGHAIAALPDGSFRVTGTHRGIDVVFGSGEPGEETLWTNGDTDIFVAAYLPSGELSWAVRAGGTELDRVGGLAVAPDGSTVVTGRFEGESTFGWFEPQERTLHSDGGTDVFVAGFSASGTLSWATRAGGTGDDSGQGIVLLSKERAIVVGTFEGSATFFPGLPYEATLNATLADIFVAHLPL